MRVIDPSGGENTLYVVFLESSEMDEDEQKSVIEEAQAMYDKLLGADKVLVKNFAEVNGGQGVMHGDFLDKSDVFAVFGSVDDVKKAVEACAYSCDFVEEFKRDFAGGEAGNPEYSENNGMNGTGRFVGLDGPFYDKEGNMQGAALDMVHGTGHNAGLSHAGELVGMNQGLREGGLMTDGNGRRQWFNSDEHNGETMQDLLRADRNTRVVDALRAKFSSVCPADNYHVNQARGKK